MRISDWSSDVCSSDLSTRRSADRPRLASSLDRLARSPRPFDACRLEPVDAPANEIEDEERERCNDEKAEDAGFQGAAARCDLPRNIGAERKTEDRRSNRAWRSRDHAQPPTTQHL